MYTLCVAGAVNAIFCVSVFYALHIKLTNYSFSQSVTSTLRPHKRKQILKTATAKMIPVQNWCAEGQKSPKNS